MLSGGGSAQLPVAKLRGHFRLLAQADRSLPARVVSYVDDGANTSVLSSLQTAASRQAWAHRGLRWPPRDEAGLFTDLAAWRIDQMRRFGEVLAALQPLNDRWGAFGTTASPDWLRHTVTIWLGGGRDDNPVGRLAELAAEGGDAVVPTLDILLSPHWASRNRVSRFDGVAPWLDQSADAVVAATPRLVADLRAELAWWIGRFGLQGRYVDLLFDLALGSSKKARTNARQALTGCDRDLLVGALERRFADASPRLRAQLVEVAAATLADAVAGLLTQWRETESAPKVIAEMDRFGGAAKRAAAEGDAAAGSRRADGPEGYWAVDGSWVEAGPPVSLPRPEPLPADLLKSLEPAMAEFNRMLVKAKAESSRERWHWSRQFAPKHRGDLKNLADLAEGTRPIVHGSLNNVVDWLRGHHFKHPAIEQFFNDPRLSLHHLARLAVATSNCHIASLFSDWGGPAGAAVRARLDSGADFRAFFELWVAAGGTDFLAGHLTQRWHMPLPDLDLPLWPLLCGRFDQIDQALGTAPQSGPNPLCTLPGLELLEQFPKLPERYRDRLMLLAGDSSARLREKARSLLQSTPGIDGAIAVQLQDGRQEVRALAADWLAARGAADEVPHIRAALDKEKSDLARAAMITALQRLGADVSAYFDSAALLREAEAGLARPRPKELDWMPLGTLPALQWADGSPVDPLLPQWWIVLATKLKQPAGNALINLWLDRLAPGDAHKLGWVVLTGWIDEDTRHPTEEEANAFASERVDAVLRQNRSYTQKWPQSADYFPTDRNLVFARLKQAKAGEYLGSAAASKGVLALAARVNGADAAQRIRPFLKDHGGRTSQAKALLDLLAAIGSSAALQLLLSAANRSKQRTVQAHAAALVEDIAERNGWSPAQLADRTVPTGGFDTNGTQDVELGEGRTYRLRLDAQDGVMILNGEGREVKALPGPRMDEEKPQVEAAKKQLANARKEVKQVLSAQTQRLQEAMFLQRNWERAEWEAFVAGHPIVGRIAARLVWLGAGEDGRVLTMFRPLGDGSYTDVEESDVGLEEFAHVRLAHSSLLAAADLDAWRRHLADYAVDPPFDQLGRALPILNDARKNERTIQDRQGWMIETFKLRGAATRLGYQRGPAQDGGWFLTYEKSYREAGLVAEIEFSGSPLPEENRQAALQSLTFRRLAAGGGGRQMMLGEVPPVLLAESWRDLHDIAEKGSGFDPGWEAKTC